MWFDGVGFWVREFGNIPETVELVLCLCPVSQEAVDIVL